MRTAREIEESLRYPKLITALERGLFEDARLTPDDINDASAAPLIEELWDYPLA